MYILVINGPNLNLLGKREPKIYGTETLYDIETRLKKAFPDDKFEFFQSNIEGVMIDKLQAAMGGAYDGIILNAGAYTHTSYALRDTIAALPVPVVEVHLSNTAARDGFRHNSVLAPVCLGVIAGFGAVGYELAVTALRARREA